MFDGLDSGVVMVNPDGDSEWDYHAIELPGDLIRVSFIATSSFPMQKMSQPRFVVLSRGHAFATILSFPEGR